MLGLSANLNYYLFNGNVDLRKGIFRLCESIREEMSLDPGKFKKPVFDEVSRCYRIQWSDMAYLTESIVVDKMYVSPKG